MKKRKISNLLRMRIFMLLFLIGALSLSAQTVTVKGTITDATFNEPVIGATVIVQGNATIGTVTDLDGNFTLSNVPTNGALEISYVGMKTQVIPVNGQTTFNVVLSEDSELLEEVVVTGYGGTQLRSKSTNSISKVATESFTKGVFSNPAQALSGKIPGVRVIQSSGDPGAAPRIILRGGTNFDGSGSPLIIVDGMVRPSMSDINPDDIESMEVMKDAGATAIYGARANNGVVLITTKKGKSGTSAIDLKVKYGVNYMNNPYEFLNAGDYLYYMRSAYQKASQYFQVPDKNGAPIWVGVQNMGSLEDPVAYGTGNIYWNKDGTLANGLVNSQAVWSPMIYSDKLAFLLDEGWETMIDPVFGNKIIYKNWDMAKANINSPANSQDYNLGFSGGNDKGTYYANIGYNRTEGMPLDNIYNRFTFTLNADYKIREWLTSITNISFQDAKWKGLPPTQGNESNYFSRMLSAPPTMRGYNANGELLLGQNSGDGNQAVNIDKFIRRNNTDKFTFGQSFKVDFTKDLSLKTNVNWMYTEGVYEYFEKDYLRGTNNWSRGRYSSASFDRNLRIVANAVLNYKKEFGMNSIDGLVGTEYYDDYVKGFAASGSGAPTDDFMALGYTSADKDKRSISSYHRRERIMSYFGRANYDYDAKYLLSAIFRYDGYSRLLGDNRWGFFPGVSAGWVFTKEPFMQDLSDKLNMSFGKLRSSYGVNGNVSGIGPYTLQGSYSAPKYDGLVGNLVGTIPNPYLRWERSNTFEIGADLSFWQNKLTTNITYYNRLTTDKFANIPLPTTSGISSITTNNGAIRNKGVEVQIDYRAINTKDWKWNLSLNGAFNKNIVVKLPDNGLERNRQGAFEVYTGNGDEKIWVGGYQEGQEPGVLYAYKAEGIYKSYDEIPGNLIDRSTGNNGSNNMWLYGPDAWNALPLSEKVKFDNKGNIIGAKALPIQPGDVKWKDVNGDGVIDKFDLVKIGNTTPRVTGGFNSVLSYKNFTFSTSLDFGLGFYIVDARTPWIMGNMQGTFNTLKEVKQSWSVDNPNGIYPQFTWADQLNKRNYARTTSMFMYKGDYVSFREVSFTYSLPKTLAEKLMMQRLDFTVTGQNLGYLTQGKNIFSPEAGTDAWGGYPLPRTMIFGLNITF